MGFRVSLQRSNPESLNVRFGSLASFQSVEPMSALPPIATAIATCGAVAKCISDQSAAQQKATLFDHLVGGDEQLLGHCQPERLGCLDVKGKLELGGLDHR